MPFVRENQEILGHSFEFGFNSDFRLIPEFSEINHFIFYLKNAPRRRCLATAEAVSLRFYRLAEPMVSRHTIRLDILTETASPNDVLSSVEISIHNG